MGIGRFARGLGKVGLAIEGLGYIVAAGRALVTAIKGDPAARREAEMRQDRAGDTDTTSDGQ